MLNKDYFSVKDLAKLDIDGHIFFRVYHHLAGFITSVSVFELRKSEEDEKELLLTELSIEEVSSDIKEKIISNDYLVDVTDDDKSLIVEAFHSKMEFIRNIAEKHLNVGLKRKMMEFLEVGGHYFGFVYEDRMPFPKLYHFNVDPIKEELYVDGVPPQMLPALFEFISPKVLKNAKFLTIQVDEGVYARVSLIRKRTALVTVVTASETFKGEAQLRVSMGFTLTQRKSGEWLATIVKEEERKQVEKEMEKNFEAIYQELLVKVFEITGMDALKGV